MLRETLQTLTCLSVLSGTYSLHMARDSYRRDDHGDVGLHTVQQVDTHDHHDNSPPIDHRLLHPLDGFMPDTGRSSEDEAYSNVEYAREAPKALQELFNTDSLDMRKDMQYSKRTPSGSGGQGNGPSTGTSSTSGIPNLPPVPHSIANQLMLRSVRGQRQYDVPQIECPPAMDGMERFACPTPDRQGRYRCIDDHVLCDGFIDCPDGEDEDRQACMFYKTTKAHLDVLADALLRWARGR
uniref:Putative mediator of rna polymerase ii transcription subunit 26-like protein n=1 Tax=Phlebotomus kandelakii TaxID=1109342 RepID=A0A6B2EAQ3_9DIPT